MYNVFGLRDHRRDKVHHRYYDERYLQVIDMEGLKLQRALGTDIHLWKQAESTCSINTGKTKKAKGLGLRI